MGAGSGSEYGRSSMAAIVEFSVVKEATRQRGRVQFRASVRWICRKVNANVSLQSALAFTSLLRTRRFADAASEKDRSWLFSSRTMRRALRNPVY